MILEQNIRVPSMAKTVISLTLSLLLILGVRELFGADEGISYSILNGGGIHAAGGIGLTNVKSPIGLVNGVIRENAVDVFDVEAVSTLISRNQVKRQKRVSQNFAIGGNGEGNGSFCCRYGQRNGFLGWLKGFTEPIVVMTPMNIVSEIAQPVAMAFRHFGNVAGGSIITMIIYTALALASSALMKLLSATIVLPILMVVGGAVLAYFGYRNEKFAQKLFGYIFAVLGFMGILSCVGVLNGVEIPILQLGIPALLSVYFDLFSGFVQAFVFSLLSMVYIAGACPPPEKKDRVVE